MISLLIAASTLASPLAPAPLTHPALQQSGTALSAPLANLQAEYNALASVTNTSGEGARDANKRIELIKGYLASVNLTAEFGKQTFGAPSNPGLTFMQAYQVALRQAQLAGASGSSATDIATLAREVGAQTTLAQDAFAKYQAALATAGQGLAFLQSKGQLDAYYAWAANSQADQRNARLAQEAALRAKTDAAAQALEDANVAAARRLQLAWDEHPIITDGNDYSWRPSQFNPSTENNGQSNYIEPSSSSPDNDLPNYWGGSYEGGYADPYYDVNGFPHGIDPNRKAWHRSTGASRGGAAPIAPPSAPAIAGHDAGGHG